MTLLPRLGAMRTACSDGARGRSATLWTSVGDGGRRNRHQHTPVRTPAHTGPRSQALAGDCARVYVTAPGAAARTTCTWLARARQPPVGLIQCPGATGADSDRTGGCRGPARANGGDLDARRGEALPRLG